MNVRKNSNRTSQLNVGGKIIDDNKEIATNFNNFFVNVGPNTEETIPKVPNISPSKFLRNHNQMKFVIAHASSEEILDIINSLENKSTGPSSIPLKLLSSIPLKLLSIIPNLGNANLSFNKFLDTLNMIIDREFKRRYKPWITNGIIKSINRKNKLFNRYCKTKDLNVKEQVYNDYKLLRNSINELLRISKKSFYASYANIKKIWQGIKEIINIKSKNFNYPTSIEVNNNIITDPVEICNNFNNYFINIADQILNKRKYSGNKHYTEYLDNHNTFFFELCDNNEVKLIIN